MLRDGENTYPDATDVSDKNALRRVQVLSGADRRDSGLRADLQRVPKARSTMIHDVIVGQAKDINATGLDTVDAGALFTESRPRFRNRRGILDERAFQICDDEVRLLKLREEIIEQSFGITLLEIRQVPSNRADISANQDRGHLRIGER